ncbi:MAG: 6-bladed beta-propeller, partial [Ignavibacteria bacterium]|nr:6-bladed beta-propeller [Ignavibacteria bacterium]
MKKLVLLIFIAATLSCGHKNRIKIEDVNQNSIQKKGTPQCLDLENAIKGEYDSQPLNTFIDTVKYIALETNQACLVGRINKVLYYKDCFYVGNFNVLLKFNSKGKFICQIGKKGKGPREYLQMRDVIIHSDSIYINGRHKILVFNLDGEYLTEFPFPADVIDFEKLDDTFVSYNKETGNLIFLNYNNGHIIDTIEYEKIEGKRIPVSVVYPHDNLFFQNSRMFCINTGHNDTIHEIDNLHRLIPRYIINLGKFKLPDKFRVEFVNLDKFDKLSAAYIRPVLIETN